MEFIKRLFENKKNLAIVGIIVAAIALPIIISQVLRQQDTRQGATGAPSINLNFTPHDKNVAVNETFEISLNLNAPQNDIGGLHFVMTYDPTLLEITDLNQPTALKVIQKHNENGNFELTLINPTNTPVTGNGLVLITFQAKALKNGTATLKIKQDIQATTGGYDTYTPIDLPDNIFATYIIGMTPTPTPCPGGANPEGCPNITPTVTPLAEACNDTDGGFNYNTKGTISGKKADGTTYSETDFCYGGGGSTFGVGPVLIEYTCNLTGQGNNNVSFNCPNGCSDGACLPPIVPIGKYCNTNADCPSGYYCPALPADSTNYPSPIFVCQPSNRPTPSVSPIVIPPPPTATSVPTAIPTSVPTLTSAPTATPVPGDTTIKLSVKLPGIGIGAANLGLNPNPVHPQREGIIQVLNQDGQSIFTNEARMTYTDGVYIGIFPLGQSFNSGTYRFKIRLGNTLYKAYPTVFNITKGLSYDPVIPAVSLISGDTNGDNALTIQDYNNYLACFKGLPSCTDQMKAASDFNDDGIVEGDLKDNNIIQYGFANQSGD